MRRSVSFILSFLIFLFLIPSCVSAAGGQCGNNLTWSLSDGILIISGAGDMQNFDSSYGYECPWQERKKEINRIIIDKGVTSVGSGAFEECVNLENVTLPSGLISIGNSAFLGCSVLPGIDIPDSVTSIGERAFENCKKLAEISIPDGVMSIGYSVIAGTAYLADPKNRTDGDIYIGKHLIEADPEKTGKYYVRDGTKCIAGMAFLGNENITSVQIPDSVVSVGKQAFYGCGALESVDVGGGAEVIGEKAFGNCAVLTSVKIGQNVKNINSEAFFECGRLNIEVAPENSAYSSEDGVLFDKDKTELIAYAKDEIRPEYSIPNGVESIGDYAFHNCENLTSVIIPESVTNIGFSAFRECAGLKDVYYNGNKDNWDALSIAEYNDCLSSAEIHFNSNITSPAKSEFVIDNNKICVSTDLGGLSFEERKNAVVFAALYDENDAVLDAYSAVYNGTDIKGEFKFSDKADHIMVFIWRKDGSLRPITDTCEYLALYN